MTKCRINNVIKNQNGFSLVELMIAIVVMAILSLPLLGYFSGALINTSKGRFLQEGKMAAQSIIEELHSYNTYEQIDAAVADFGNPLSIDADEPPATGFLFLKKNIMVDNKNMIAKIAMDFNYDNTGSGVAYNEYEVPQIKSLYTDSSIVAVEKDQLAVAIDEFYIRNDFTFSKNTIKADLERNINVNISKNALNSDLVDIKVNHVFTYNGDSYTAPSVLSTQTTLADFERMFLLYNQYRSDMIVENVGVNVSGFSQAEAKKINLYIIRQETSIVRPVNYQMLITGTGAYLDLNYYTNQITTNLPNEDDYIISEKENRIAHITVDVYNEGETSFTEEKRMLRIESAKGE